MITDQLPYLVTFNAVASGTTTIVMTVGNNGGYPVLPGDVVIVSGGGGTAVPTGVSDTQSHSYTLIESNTGTDASWQFVAVATNGLRSDTPDTITATYSGTGAAKQVVVTACSIIATSSTVDSGASATASGTSAAPSVTSGSRASTATGELIVAVLDSANAGGAPTWPGTWNVIGTAQTGSGPYCSVAVRANVTGTTAVTASPTIGSSQTWTMCIIALKPAAVTQKAPVGATVFPNAYPSAGTRLAASVDFDSSSQGTNRKMAEQFQKTYLTEGQHLVTVNTENFTPNQPIGTLLAAGIYQLVCEKPTRAVGGGVASEVIYLAGDLITIKNYIASLGPGTPGFAVCLWQECNLAGGQGAFGNGAQYGSPSPYPAPYTDTQAAINYQQYVAYYGPTVQAAGIPLVYDPAIASGGTCVPFFPGRSLCNAYVVDFYCNDFTKTSGGYNLGTTASGSSTGSSVIAQASGTLAGHTFSPALPFGLGEMGLSDQDAKKNPTPPTYNQFHNWLYYQVVAPLLAIYNAGGQLAWTAWYTSGTGFNSVNNLPTGWSAGQQTGSPGGVTPNELQDIQYWYDSLNPSAAGSPVITTTSLPNATVGVAYSKTLAETGGTGPFTWSVTSTAVPGLSIAGSTGVYSGTPTSAGSYSVSFKVTDSLSNIGLATLPLTVAPGAGSPNITTTTLPGGVEGQSYSAFVAATGGTPPYTWSLQSGSLPPGVTLTGAGAIVGTPTAAGLFSFVMQVTDNASLSDTQPLSITVTGSILQQVPGSSTFDYGSSMVEISTTQGSTLIVLAGWDLSTSPTSAPMPAVNVTDSAGNLWIHVATSSSGVSGSRSSAWICPNAFSVDWISVTLTTFASSLAYTVLEMAGMPDYYSLDVLDTNAAASVASLTLSPGAATVPDFAFTVFTAGSITNVPSTPSGWTALNPVTAGGVTGSAAGEANAVEIFPFFMIPSPGTNLGATYGVFGSPPMSGVTFAVQATVPGPVQTNPNFPVWKVEMGFGYTPGDVTQAPPAWTDVTNRVIGPEGQAFVTVTAGRQYELATAEAGTMEIWLNNQDGAFTPGNLASPFYPGVVLGTPVRVSAWWDGQWYAIGYGWAERLPQAWPDLPQWGIVKMTAHDAIAVASAETMVSALNGDLLIDAPYVLLPANEQYLTFSNGINTPGSLDGSSSTGTLGSFTAADAQGLLSQNYSRVNQRAGVYVDGNSAATGGSGPAIAATGQTTNLLGTGDTGFGTSAITTAPTTPASGPGIIYTDPNMPDPVTGSGVTVTFWVIIPGPDVTSHLLEPVVFTAYGTPSSYRTANASLQVQIENFTGGSTLQVTLADGSTTSAPFTVSASPQQITLAITASQLAIYVNGALGSVTALTAAQTTAWTAVTLGCPNYAYGTGGLVTGSFTAFSLAIYPYQLPVQRDVSHYATGISGQQGGDAITRVGQILSWAGLGLARGGQATFTGTTVGLTEGPAYNLAGATPADAISQVALNESGQVATWPTGALVFFHNWALYDQAPVAVFGDSPDPTQGEIPYLQAQSWGYDDQYLYNLVQVTQQSGANNLFTVTSANLPSQQSYNPRTALAQTITTTSAQDAYDLANWEANKYSQPSLRVAGLTVDASSNPTAAFPVVLPLLQGQVVTVTRRPVGGAVISQQVLVQKIVHAIGASTWSTALQLSPYDPEDSVLQLDGTNYDTVGNATLP